jgi:hypothetical protein
MNDTGSAVALRASRFEIDHRPSDVALAKLDRGHCYAHASRHPGRVPHVCTGKAGALHGLNKPGRSPFRFSDARPLLHI